MSSLHMSSQKNIYLTCKQFSSKYLSVNHFANASHTLLVLIKEKKRVNGTTKNCRQGTPTPAAISWQKLPGAQNAQFLAFECNFKVAWHIRRTREITSGQQEPINTPKLEWPRFWSFKGKLPIIVVTQKFAKIGVRKNLSFRRQRNNSRENCEEISLQKL